MILGGFQPHSPVVYTMSQKKLSRFVFVTTSSNFQQFW